MLSLAMLGRATLPRGSSAVVLASHPRGSGGAGAPAGAAEGVLPRARTHRSPTAKFVHAVRLPRPVDKGLTFLKTSCPATCGYCKGGAGASSPRVESAADTAQQSGEVGRTAAQRHPRASDLGGVAPRGRRKVMRCNARANCDSCSKSRCRGARRRSTGSDTQSCEA